MRLAAPLALALVVAGCLTPITDRLRASDVEAPEWKVGDWWRYSLNSTTYALEGIEVTIVVANETPNGFVLGYAADDDATLPLLFHMPAIGPVTDTLAYDVHEIPFEPLQFPLEEGKEWTTTWIAGEVRLTARQENATWRVNNTGAEASGGLTYDLVYDPDARAITRFTRVGTDGVVRQNVQLVERGANFTGDVITITSPRVVLLESRTAAPGLPRVPFGPPEGVDTLLVGCIAGGQPGQYFAEVRTGAGVVCQVDRTNQPGATDFGLQVVEAPADAAGWEARLAAVGPGSATAEVLGYATRIVTLGANDMTG